MKITLWLYMQNAGDGSANARVFPSKRTAELYAETTDLGGRFCDDISSITIEVDAQGNLLQPPLTKIDSKGILRENYKIVDGKKTYKYTNPTDWDVRNMGHVEALD